MAPLQKINRRPLSSASLGNPTDQSPRSEASIAAQAAAAAFEDAKKNAFREGRSTPVSVVEEPVVQKQPAIQVVEKPSMKKSTSAPNVRMMQGAKRLSAGQTPMRNQAYMPVVSSPLNPNSPPDSLTSRNSNGDSISEIPETITNPDAITPAIPPIPPIPQSTSSTPKRRPLSAHMLKVPPGGTQVHTRELSSSSIPLSMSSRGLGGDYTRYFNPFTDSRRNSYQEVPSGAQTPGLYTNASRLSVFETLSEKSAIDSIDSKDPNQEKLALLQQSFLDDRLASSPYLIQKGQPNGFPMFLDEKEDDDDMHMPMPDDNVRFRTTLRERFNRENACTTFGLIFMMLGLSFLFVALPILFYTGTWTFHYAYDSPRIDPQADDSGGLYGPPQSWAKVNDREYPLLQNIRTGPIDPDTPDSAMTKIGTDGTKLRLTFSDEFNQKNRTFYAGDDPYWEAQDIWYGATGDLEWYDPDAVTTWDGVLELRMDQFPNHNLKLRSGMLNSWNKMCFKGGLFEVSVSLPGPAGTMGLWPGVWTMGNLGRPGYLATTDGLWPYTYNDCDAGITPNQSDPSGISRLPGQRLPACTCAGEDHPTPGTGRGAPEIDILEASASYTTDHLGVVTQSFQVAPFDAWYMPDYDYMAFPDPSVSFTNSWTGGPYQQAVSGVTAVNNDWYDGKQYQTYSFDYRSGTRENGWITWTAGDQSVFKLDGRAIRQNGNIGDRAISEEPMSIVMNLGISNSWVAINWEELMFPTIMRIDYVRIYQPEGQEMITCDPPGYETTQYIADHMLAYTNPNLTHWSQAKYDWPKHKLNNPGCQVGSK